MGLSKNLSVLKALVEEMLRRDYHNSANRDEKEVNIALSVLDSMIGAQRLYVAADTSRISQSFADKMRRQYSHISYPEQLLGLHRDGTVHLVMLHTGARSPRQHEIHCALKETLTTLPDVIVYHIGDW